MGFQDTINEIFKGLTGDNKADIQYLKEQMEQHRDDENSTEIIRALGRKVFELLPDEAKAELNQIIGNEVDTINSTVEEAKFQLSQNNPLKAEELLKSAIDSIPLEFKDDEENVAIFALRALWKLLFSLSLRNTKRLFVKRPTILLRFISCMLIA